MARLIMDTQVLSLAVMVGAGIGFLTFQETEERPEMVQVAGPRPEWSAPLWLVTHMDLHRTGKVQALCIDDQRKNCGVIDLGTVEKSVGIVSDAQGEVWVLSQNGLIVPIIAG